MNTSLTICTYLCKFQIAQNWNKLLGGLNEVSLVFLRFLNSEYSGEVHEQWQWVHHYYVQKGCCGKLDAEIKVILLHVTCLESE